MEVELGWGIHDKGEFSHLSKQRHKETKTLEALLSICDDYTIPFSFDVAGHLLHESCNGHPESPHPPNWFDTDPETDCETDPLFYAPDLISSIRDANTKHEICTHTFSHVLCNCFSDNQLSWELDQVNTVHREFGLESPKSIVTPRHQAPSYDVLREYDIRIIRKPVQDYRDDNRGKISTFKWILTRSHPIQPAAVQGEIIESYCTPHPSLTATHLPSGQKPPHPVFSAIPVSVRKRLHEKYLMDALDTAVEMDSDLHLWTHLFNLSNKHQLEVLQNFLSSVSHYRDNNDISIVTMNDFATELTSND